VLVMEFIGEDGWPAPLLKNAELDCPKLIDKLYCDCVRIMCDLYRKCRLVHAGSKYFVVDVLYVLFADLSEYNMLLLHQKLFVIDVSQSVEHDHPHALEFLRMDIGNVTRFFRERGAHVLTMMRLFEVLLWELKKNNNIFLSS
jgi:RIO kinase 1